MPNGRALPSALLFDWLLGRAWDMAKISYANAQKLGAVKLNSPEIAALPDPGIESFLSKYAGNEAASLVSGHDQSLRGQMREVAEEWATQFQAVLTNAVPVGAGFQQAVAWLRSVVNGQDKLGYLGQDLRLAQAQGYANQNHNPRGLPLPPGAAAALQSVGGRMSALHVNRLGVQMQADRTAEVHKMRIDAAEALLRAHNAALDAVMEHMFTQMHLMFDVFGRNNDYLNRLQRREKAISACLQIRAAELASWGERVSITDDSFVGATQQTKAVAERANTIAQMTADAHVRLLRRYSSRAAAALNSAGVSVNSTASESNNIDAEE